MKLNHTKKQVEDLVKAKSRYADMLGPDWLALYHRNQALEEALEEARMHIKHAAATQGFRMLSPSAGCLYNALDAIGRVLLDTQAQREQPNERAEHKPDSKTFRS